MVLSSSPVPSNTEGCDGRAPAPLHVYLAGVGTVGAALLDQMAGLPAGSRPLRVIGARTSERAVWAASGIEPAGLADRLQAPADDWPAALQRLVADAPRPLAFVDATDSEEVVRLYEPLLENGVHVVTPNKRANAGSQARYDRLQSAASRGGAEYRYETTVGAGLPVVRTVQDLVRTGDRVRSIRGAVSGTLTFLFASLRQGDAFAEAVETAEQRGYTEPDVREDLSGQDVARKFLILARTAGRSVDPADVEVESLVPDALASVSVDAFHERLPEANAHWRSRSSAASDEGRVLQYVGRLGASGIEVGVRAVERASALGRLNGQNNLFEITTDRYADAPLRVSGPGAGPAVTAGGVLADLLQVARQLQARRA
jgi:aspartokinase/homoserine dehydrogenase 1